MPRKTITTIYDREDIKHEYQGEYWLALIRRGEVFEDYGKTLGGKLPFVGEPHELMSIIGEAGYWGGADRIVLYNGISDEVRSEEHGVAMCNYNSTRRRLNRKLLEPR